MGKSRIIGACLKLLSLQGKSSQSKGMSVIFSDPELQKRDEPLYETMLLSSSLDQCVTFASSVDSVDKPFLVLDEADELLLDPGNAKLLKKYYN